MNRAISFIEGSNTRKTGTVPARFSGRKLSVKGSSSSRLNTLTDRLEVLSANRRMVGVVLTASPHQSAVKTANRSGSASPTDTFRGYALIGQPRKWRDWGRLSTHIMTTTGKAITKAFYGRDAKRSYYTGCSTGGQQGLIESLYYPADYDGILVGAVANVLHSQLGRWADFLPELPKALNLDSEHGVIGLFVMMTYYALMEASPRSATVGKLAMGIVVTDAAGRPLSPERACGRAAARILSMTTGIGFLLALFTKKSQALHDLLANTVVVKRS